MPRTITSEILKAWRHRAAEEELHFAEEALNSLAAKEGSRDTDDVATAIVGQI